MAKRIIWKDIEGTWVRVGECNRCGHCCVIDKCPHFKFVNGLATCLIYDKRDQICEECSAKRTGPNKYVTHKVCVGFPEHPHMRCLKTGQCGYKFVRK